MSDMDESGKKIFEEFAGQLSDWSKTGKLPSAGNQDIRYALSLLSSPNAISAFIQSIRGGGSIAGSALELLLPLVVSGVFGAIGGYIV